MSDAPDTSHDDATPDATPDGPRDDAGTAGAGSVTTGVLAAERTARDRLARRRRRLVAGAVLGGIIALAVVATMTVLQGRANEEARLAAQRADARAAFGGALVERAEAYEALAVQIDVDAGGTEDALREHVVASPRTDEEVDALLEGSLAELQEDAAALELLRAEPAPEPDDLIAEGRAVRVLQELEVLRAEAGALVEEVAAAAEGARAWSDAVRGVTDALADHAAVVAAQPETSDPDELAELWREEAPSLRALRARSVEATEVEGLAAWANAHRAYANDALGWIDEAVALLEEADVDTYNERFEEVVAVEDPYGFAAAVDGTIGTTLESPALGAVRTLRTRVEVLLDAVRGLEVLVADELTDDDPVGTDPTDGASPA